MNREDSLSSVVKATENFNQLERSIEQLIAIWRKAGEDSRVKLQHDILRAQGNYLEKFTDLIMLKAKLGIVGNSWYKK